jgi:polysaccharide deacetylase 2 family uncharacterized protein YibQ
VKATKPAPVTKTRSVKKKSPPKETAPATEKTPPLPKPRRPRKKKLTLEDRLKFVLFAAIGIFAAGLVFVGLLIFEPSPANSNTADMASPGESASNGIAPETLPPEPPSSAVADTPAPAVSAAPQQTAAATSRSAPPEAAPARRTELPLRPMPRRGGTLVFIIDDAGNNLRELEPFLKFPGPLTIAVLPGLPNSAEAARRIRAAGKEVFLHQPMEALGGQSPGPGAVYTGMSGGEIRAIIERNLDEIGPVAGINNHQGSRVTMDETAMETVLAICRERGICFLDSRTTADTVAPRVAKRMGISIGERDVFLDNIQERASMIRYVNDGLERAESRGAAVMIGHTWSPDLAPVLETLYPELLDLGYTLTTASRHLGGLGQR